jgi:hypothetical protein
MLIPHTAFKGTIKPLGLPKINWSDPRTVGLVHYYILDGSVCYDAVTGQTFPKTGTVSGTTRSFGSTAYFQSQFTTSNYYIVGTKAVLGGSAFSSVVAGVMLKSTDYVPGIWVEFPIYSERAASGNDIYKIGLGNPGSVGYAPVGVTIRNDAGTLINNFGSTDFDDDKFHVISLTKAGSGSSNVIGYADGVPQVTATWNTNDNFTDANMKCVIAADIAGTTSGFPDYISFVALYKIALSRTAIYAMSKDPYGMLIYPQDYLYELYKGVGAVAPTNNPSVFSFDF